MPLSHGKSEKSFKKNVATEMEAGKPQKQSLAIAYSIQRKAKAKKMAEGGAVDENGQPIHMLPEPTPKSSDLKEEKHQAVKPQPAPTATPLPTIKPSSDYDDYDYGNEPVMVTGTFAQGGDVSIVDSIMSKRKMAKGGKVDPNDPDFMKKDPSYQGPSGPIVGGSDPFKKTDWSDTVEEMSPEEMSPEEVKQTEREIENPEHGASGSWADGGMVDRIMSKRKMMSEGGRVANDTVHEDEIDQYDDLVLRDDLAFSETGANSGDELGDAGEDERRKDIVSRIMRSRKLKDKLPNPR